MAPTKAQLLAKRTAGRPRVYDSEKIAKELMEWANNEYSINIVQFCAEYEYLPGLIWRLNLESEEFSRAYTIAKMKLAARRENLLNANLLNYGAWQRYQRDFDPFLDANETDRENKEAARRKNIVEDEQMNFVKLAKLVASGEVSQKE